jgi:hypothetical protein
MSAEEAQCIRAKGYNPDAPGLPDDLEELNARTSCASTSAVGGYFDQQRIAVYCDELTARQESAIAGGMRLKYSEGIDLGACERGEEPPGFDLWLESQR